MGRSLRAPLTGIGRYTLNLSRALLESADPPELSLYVTRETPDLALDRRCRVVRAPMPTPHEVLRGVWEQSFVAADVRRSRPDVYHSPNYATPVSLPCPSVLTVHDLAYLDPAYHKRRLRLYLRLFTAFSVKRASRIIVVSHFTGQQVAAHFPHARDRIAVVHNGLDPRFGCMPAAARVRAFLDSIGQRKPYVLFVGSIEPRKNVPRLVRAFEIAVERSGAPHDLVLCGPWAWRFGPSKEAVEQSPLRERIKTPGYVSDEDLPSIYAGADALVYPSLQEGFGFPPLEAMAMGVPVVTSDNSSLPEVVGDAALKVTPTDTNGLAEAIERVLTDKSLSQRLRDLGPRQAAGFSWRKAADATMAVYREAVAAGRPS